MRLPGAGHLRRLARQVRSRWEGRALVLGYHRVADEPDDPFELTVSPDHFVEQMEVLRRVGRPVRLDGLAASLARQEVERGRLAVTFDDGYADLLQTVMPALERFEVPATLFVVSGYLGRTLWWDELHRAVSAAEGIPEIRLPEGIADDLHVRDGGGPGGGRGGLLEALYWRFRDLPGPERERALDDVARWARGSGRPPAPRTFTAAEVARVARRALIDVGSHSVSHPDMTGLARAAAVRELVDSKEDLEAIVGRPVTGFSCPFGSASPSLGALIRETGYRFACTSRADAVGRSTDPFAMPRLWVPDLSGAEFRDWLGRWI